MASRPVVNSIRHAHVNIHVETELHSQGLLIIFLCEEFDTSWLFNAEKHRI